jgi:hypothetical protein
VASILEARLTGAAAATRSAASRAFLALRSLARYIVDFFAGGCAAGGGKAALPGQHQPVDAIVVQLSPPRLFAACGHTSACDAWLFFSWRVCVRTWSGRDVSELRRGDTRIQ